jgi:hypothetical protein
VYYNEHLFVCQEVIATFPKTRHRETRPQAHRTPWLS